MNQKLSEIQQALKEKGIDNWNKGPTFGLNTKRPVSFIIAFASWMCAPVTTKEEKICYKTGCSKKSIETFTNWLKENKFKNITKDSFGKFISSAICYFKILSKDKENNYKFTLNIKDHQSKLTSNLVSKMSSKIHTKIIDSIINNKTINGQDVKNSDKFAIAFSNLLDFMSKNPKNNDSLKLWTAMRIFTSGDDFEKLYKSNSLYDLYNNLKNKRKSSNEEKKLFDKLNKDFSEFNSLAYELGFSKSQGVNCKEYNNSAIIKTKNNKFKIKEQPLPNILPYSRIECSQMLKLLQDYSSSNDFIDFNKFPNLEGCQYSDIAEYFGNLSAIYCKYNDKDLQNKKLMQKLILEFNNKTLCDRNLQPIGHVSKNQPDFWEIYTRSNNEKSIVTYETNTHTSSTDAFKNEWIGVSKKAAEKAKLNNIDHAYVMLIGNIGNNTPIKYKNLQKKWYSTLNYFAFDNIIPILTIQSFIERADWVEHPEKMKEFMENHEKNKAEGKNNLECFQTKIAKPLLDKKEQEIQKLKQQLQQLENKQNNIIDINKDVEDSFKKQLDETKDISKPKTIKRKCCSSSSFRNQKKLI